MVTVLVTGASGFHYIEDWPWFDGFYMTLITMTTVGYGETHPLSHEGRIFNVFVILGAVISGGLLIGVFTQWLLELELGNIMGRRRMQREIAKLRDHYIICGAGRVGRTVAHELTDHKVPLVVIEQDPSRAEWAARENIPVIIGSAHSEGVLLEAHIESAKGLVAAVTSDADNLYIVLTASGMRSDLKIIARASDEQAIPKLLRAGAAQVLSPYHFIGHRIVQLLLRPNVLDFVDTAFGTNRVNISIEEVRVSEKSPLTGKTLAEADIRQKTGALVLALKRIDGEMEFSPPPDARLRAGDCLIAIGKSEDLRKLESVVGD
jgi:voltage-gated potassium channel